jgi:ligand-binding SRPBCC domain-containing protein
LEYFTFTTVIHASRARVFHFHDNPENLTRVSPPHIRVVVERFDAMALGAQIELTVYPIRFLKTKWLMEISSYKPTTLFEDTMLHGPFSAWTHRREFSGSHERTILNESVRYELPFGIFGRLSDEIIVRQLVRNMFSYRQQRIKELLEAPD